MAPNLDAYRRWQQANELARARENELNRAWNEFFDRRSQKPPSDDLIAEVQRLRRAADELLTQVIAAGRPGAAPGAQNGGTPSRE